LLAGPQQIIRIQTTLLPRLPEQDIKIDPLLHRGCPAVKLFFGMAKNIFSNANLMKTPV